MNTSDSVRRSSEARNVFFIPPEPGSTSQSVGLQQWTMPWLSEGVPLYDIERVLGRGSFSVVCLAVDAKLVSEGHRNPMVALKRVPNVLADHRQAKLVLREIAVLRRIRHPNVLQLRSAFLQPSSVGECRLIGGKLVHTAVDLYIATEFAEGGDLYSMRGNLTDRQVARVMWNMLEGISYLHSCGIWHRDIKSQNAFLFREKNGMTWRVKLGDFGSSVWRGDDRGDDRGEKYDDEYDDEYDDKYGGNGGNGQAGGGRHISSHAHHPDAQPLTRQVCTPCYRAPEVVMSRGKYTDAVDIWGLGCIFGELLSRISYVGSTSNSKLRVAPLFAVRDFPSVTPAPGELPADTKKELDALFKVIGTPSWRDVEMVGMVEWRTFLGTLPARAPTLMRRFKNAGEVAIHLLTRLLEFDPDRRLTCEEAMQHEYFAELREEEAEYDRVNRADMVVADEMNVEELSPAVERQLSMQETAANTRNTSGLSSPPASSRSSCLSARTTSITRDEDGLTIGQALAKLERELEQILHDEDTAEENPHDFFSAKTQRLLGMLTKECEAVTSLAPQPSDAEDEDGARNTQGACHALRRNKSRAKDMTASRSSLVEDVVMDDSEYARGRMSNVRDTWAGNELDASKFLKANRHGEWSEWSSERAGDGRRAAPAQGWGVSVEAPRDQDAQYAAAIRQQQMK